MAKLPKQINARANAEVKKNEALLINQKQELLRTIITLKNAIKELEAENEKAGELNTHYLDALKELYTDICEFKIIITEWKLEDLNLQNILKECKSTLDPKVYNELMAEQSRRQILIASMQQVIEDDEVNKILREVKERSNAESSRSMYAFFTGALTGATMAAFTALAIKK